MGAKIALPITESSPEVACRIIHSNNNRAAPASSTKIDQGSTAPKASEHQQDKYSVEDDAVEHGGARCLDDRVGGGGG